MSRIALSSAACLTLLLTHDVSSACSCAARSPAQTLTGAEMVFLAKAGKQQIQGKLAKRPFEVLHVLKGRPGPRYERVLTAGVIPPCHRGFKEGEVALLFVSKGAVHLCSGNFPLDAVLPNLGRYLRLAASRAKPKRKLTRPGLAVFRRALEAMLPPYLHARPKVPVIHPALKGQSIQISKSTLPFVSKAKRRKAAVKIREAICSGPVCVISGRYPLEGFNFGVLLMKHDDTWQILGKQGAET